MFYTPCVSRNGAPVAPLTLDPVKGWVFDVPPKKTFIVQNTTDAIKLAPSLVNKRILMVVRGYSTRRNDLLSTLETASKKIKNTYDAIIGYSYSQEFFYLTARETALAASEAFRNIINQFSNSKIDIVAHSMGVFLTFNALNGNIIPNIYNLYVLGGADRQESLNDCLEANCTNYQEMIRNVSAIYVFMSCNDWVLPFHKFLTGEQAIGSPTKWDKPTLASNVTVIDTTSVVNSHGGYLESDAVYNHIAVLSQCSLSAKYYSLKEDGDWIDQREPRTCPTWTMAINRFVFKN